MFPHFDVYQFSQSPLVNTYLTAEKQQQGNGSLYIFVIEKLKTPT